MKNMPQIIALLLLFHCGASVASGRHGPTSLAPSPELLQLVGISDYQTNKEIRMIVGSAETRGTSGQMGQCDNPVVIPLKALARIKNVSKVIAAIETVSHGKQKRLFTLQNDGGLNRWNGYFSVQLDIREYNPGTSNLWVFFFSEGQAYANAAQIQCQVVQ